VAWLFFVDESGQDHRQSPYEVLATVGVRDADLWNLICAVHDLEIHAFGRRYSGGDRELKARILLKTKVFRQRDRGPVYDAEERTRRAKAALDNGDGASTEDLAALAQAKLWFVDEVLKACARFRCVVFASVVVPGAPTPGNSFLRKDYAFLFERIYAFLERQQASEQGIVVFDELERSRSHVLVGQMQQYFLETGNGRLRSGRIVPEPFFVHSDLTTGVQLADLAAYLISWNVRIARLALGARSELDPFGEQIRQLAPPLQTSRGGEPFTVFPFAVIDDLRPRSDQ
jgi:hypothetical protein